MEKVFRKYVEDLKKFGIGEITEHTYRKELQELLEEIASVKGLKLTIQHEPKRNEIFGAPDFKVKSTEAIIGYVENKKLTENLKKIIVSDQIKKYKSLSSNILLTNYIDWVWIKDGEVIDSASLCELSDIQNRLTTFISADKISRVEEIITNFYSQVPKGIGKPKELAEVLAIRARYLRDFLHEELERQNKEHQEGRLYGLFDSFKKNIFAELTTKEFADAFSQTLVYGLFLSKLNANNQVITLYNAKHFILPAFGLISELIDFIDELEKKVYKDSKWIVEEILSVMNTLDLKSILKNLSYSKKRTTDIFNEKSTTYTDPYIYFYENFLAAYDRKLRKQKGVYYTPPQVVSFIVRSVNDILENIFKIESGFADREKITVLDFATGTGTFILQIIELILESLPKDSGKKESVISEHILKNLFGFEYLIAPYTIANLKLSQYLKDQKYQLKEEDRFQVYLTNTLEPTNTQISIPLLPTLSKESRDAQTVKDKPILVITGNPPYSHHSKNKGQWILSKIKDYYIVDGQKLAEKNPKALQDDYVKFMRFAQWKMDNVDEGVIAIITNHTFLFNLTFPGMRQQLMESFDQLYFLDLHGSNKMKEKTPDGARDENVFDIEQGVAISFLIKKKGLEKKIFHSNLWGKREDKYSFCQDNIYLDCKWTELHPSSPFYLFRKIDEDLWNSYKDGFHIKKDIFALSTAGIKSHRDHFVVDISDKALRERISKFLDMKTSDSEVEETFQLKTKDDWNLNKVRLELSKNNNVDSYFTSIYYRPFDFRHLFYHKSVITRHRKPLIDDMLFENVAITVGRAGIAAGEDEDWNLVHITKTISDTNLFTRGGADIFQLYHYSENLFEKSKTYTKEPNFKNSFVKQLKSILNFAFEPEDVFGYMYAILHSPTYRKKYKDYLLFDFPRIKFNGDKEIFFRLSAIGWELINTHLFKTIPSFKHYPFGTFKGLGNNKVSHRTFSQDTPNGENGKLHINKSQHFENIPLIVWNYFIGGYQVLDKYLKDREDRTLGLDEIENIERVIRVLSFTLNKSEEIDTLTKEWI